MGTMREILFRGKRVDNGEWAVGSLLLAGAAANIFEDADQNYIFGVRAVELATVGQYTGLKDKNDKRIFEGDIVKSHYINAKKNDFVEQVVFHNGRFCALFNFSGNGRMWTNLPDGIPHLPQDKTPCMDWCEIIGNIHDNPELLEGGVNDD